MTLSSCGHGCCRSCRQTTFRGSIVRCADSWSTVVTLDAMRAGAAVNTTYLDGIERERNDTVVARLFQNSNFLQKVRPLSVVAVLF
jgi:hypothetical protein